MRKTPIARLSGTKAGRRNTADSWHGGGGTEIYLYGRAVRNAAKTLIVKLGMGRAARTDWDACPVVLLYRQALEIHLKMLAGEGSNLLKQRIDPISLYTTHSLRWLAQIVCQIIRTTGWEGEFTCEGIGSLAEFSAAINEVEAFDPVSRAIGSSRAGDPESVCQYFRAFDILLFAKSMDALLDLLDATADGLAAARDMRENAAAGSEPGGGDDTKQTIH